MKSILIIATIVSLGLSLYPARLFAQSTTFTNEQRTLMNSGVYSYDLSVGSVCNNVGIVNGNVDRFLQVLAYQESGGNPQADASPASTASGKYQYLDGTWRGRASLYEPAGSYARAKQAPEAVQDAVAYIEYAQKFRDLNNDLFKLALSHFYPLAITDTTKLDTKIGNNTITPRQYADKLIENMGKGIGKDIPLNYQAAPEFDAWLAKVGGPPPDVNSGSGTTGSRCASIGSISKVIEIAQTELQADGSHTKYGGAVEEPWCGYFASWVFKEAGKPFGNGAFGSVQVILDFARNEGYFHAQNEEDFVPQPGDVVIYKEGIDPFPSHVNIVVSYNEADSTITTIGGNEGNTIKQQTWDTNMAAITGYMRLP